MRCAMLALALAGSLFAQAAVDAQTRATPVAKGGKATRVAATKTSGAQKAKKKAPTDFKTFLEEKMVEVVQRYGLSEAKARLLLKDLQATSKAAREEFAKIKEKAK